MTEPTKTPAKRRNLTTRQKAEAIALWQSGEITYSGLVAKFNKSKSTFQKLFAREGVKHGEKGDEVSAAVQSRVREELTDDASKIARRIKETKEEHYQLSTAIAKLTGRLIMKAAQSPDKPISVHHNEFKALREAMHTLMLARNERFHVLGIADGEKDSDDELPELGVHELTQEQIADMAKARGDSDDEEFEQGLLELDKQLKESNGNH